MVMLVWKEHTWNGGTKDTVMTFYWNGHILFVHQLLGLYL